MDRQQQPETAACRPGSQMFLDAHFQGSPLAQSTDCKSSGVTKKKSVPTSAEFCQSIWLSALSA
jgi:hypothetical protein